VLKIVAISDVHERWHNLVIPECDVLLSCGDYSYRGSPQVVREFHKWLDKQNARYIVSVQGNHELWVESNFNLAKQIAMDECPEIIFIDEGAFEIDGVKFYGSAIQPWFHSWAWNRHPGEIKKHWDAIPDDTQVLLTHSPPYGILDRTCYADGTVKEIPLGCPQLLTRINQLKDLKLHFFGHIHFEGGQQKEVNGVKYFNAAICDEAYSPSNPITVVDYENI
jgi:Icc-related predicted phosphoesterase